MRNGYEPSPFAHLAQNEPPSADVLRFAEDVKRVQAIVASGALDGFDVDERIRIGWAIIRQMSEVQN